VNALKLSSNWHEPDTEPRIQPKRQPQRFAQGTSDDATLRFPRLLTTRSLFVETPEEFEEYTEDEIKTFFTEVEETHPDVAFENELSHVGSYHTEGQLYAANTYSEPEFQDDDSVVINMPTMPAAPDALREVRNVELLAYPRFGTRSQSQARERTQARARTRTNTRSQTQPLKAPWTSFAGAAAGFFFALIVSCLAVFSWTNYLAVEFAELFPYFALASGLGTYLLLRPAGRCSIWFGLTTFAGTAALGTVPAALVGKPLLLAQLFGSAVCIFLALVVVGSEVVPSIRSRAQG
jgi:hypothetical protein